MPLSGVIRYESVIVSSAAIGMTTTVADGQLPHAAVITVEDATLRYREDGTDPTASEGHQAGPGDVITLTQRDQVVNFRAIRKDGVDATIRISQGVGYLP